MPQTFVISDESINSYGTRILTEGIDLSLFQNNPIMLWMHSRATWGARKDDILPIGRWENIRIEGTQLLADPVFDENDDFAMKIKSKVDGGFIKMASANFDIVATSEDVAVLEKGQTRPTIIQSLLKEVSLVDIGGNRNALILFDEFGVEIKLADGEDNHLLPLLSEINLFDNMKFQEQITQVLKLSDGASEAEILLAVQQSAQNAIKLADLQGQVTTLAGEKTALELKLKGFEDAEKAAEETKRVELVDGAIAAKKITAAEKESFLKLATADFDSTKKILDGMTGVTELGDKTHGDVKLSAFDQRMKEINENIKKH